MTACPKCRAASGGDWSQCKGVCPMPQSPHHTANLCLTCLEPKAENDYFECPDCFNRRCESEIQRGHVCRRCHQPYSRCGC